MSPHGGAPRIEWRNEFAMLVRTAPIQQALTCHHRSHIFGVRELELLLASPPPSMPAVFFSLHRPGRARSIAGRDGMRRRSRASGFLASRPVRGENKNENIHDLGLGWVWAELDASLQIFSGPVQPGPKVFAGFESERNTIRY